MAVRRNAGKGRQGKRKRVGALNATSFSSSKKERQAARALRGQGKAAIGLVPMKAIPRALVERLRAWVEKGQGPEYSAAMEQLARMRIADHRRGEQNAPFTDLSQWGRRVREMDVSGNFPNLKTVIVKVTDAHPAKTEIARVKGVVQAHNAKFKPKNYELRMLPAEEIGKDLVAMPKVNAPSLEELRQNRTKRARNFQNRAKKAGFSVKEVLLAGRTLGKRTSSKEDRILFLGVKGRRFVFTLLIDTY